MVRKKSLPSKLNSPPQRLHLGALGTTTTVGRRRLLRVSLDQRQPASDLVTRIHKQGLSHFSLVLLTSVTSRATPTPPSNVARWWELRWAPYHHGLFVSTPLPPARGT